jgi:hypothetical protein
MMRVLTLLCALLLGVGAALLTGCGDRSKLLPQKDAAALRTQLQAVNGAVGAKNCQQTDAAISQARTRVKALPSSVDGRLVERLLSGLTTLRDRAAGECNPAQVTTTTVPTTTTTTTTQTQTTTDTAPPQTTGTSTQPVTPTSSGTTGPTVPGPADGGATPAPGTTGTTPPTDGGASPSVPGTPPPPP